MKPIDLASLAHQSWTVLVPVDNFIEPMISLVVQRQNTRVRMRRPDKPLLWFLRERT